VGNVIVIELYAYAKFRCPPVHIKKALGIFGPSENR